MLIAACPNNQSTKQHHRYSPQLRSPLMGGRLPLRCAVPSAAPAKPAGMRVGDSEPSRAGDTSRDGCLLGGADSTWALRRASAAALAAVGTGRPAPGTGTEDCRSRRWMASAAAAAEAAAAAMAPGAKRGDTALLLAELGEATEPGQADSARATAAASAPALVGADNEGTGTAYAWRGSMVRHASERGRSRPASPLPPLPSSAELLLLAGSPRAPGWGSGGRLGGANTGAAMVAAAAAAIAASRPGLEASARLAFKSSRLANSWCSGMRFSDTVTEGDRMPPPVLAGDSAPLPMPSGEAAASRPAGRQTRVGDS